MSYSKQTPDIGATLSLMNAEASTNIYSKNKQTLIQLIGLYSEALDSLATHNEIYYSVLMLVKKGFIEIIDELFETIETDSYIGLETQVMNLQSQK